MLQVKTKRNIRMQQFISVHWTTASNKTREGKKGSRKGMSTMSEEQLLKHHHSPAQPEVRIRLGTTTQTLKLHAANSSFRQVSTLTAK